MKDPQQFISAWYALDERIRKLKDIQTFHLEQQLRWTVLQLKTVCRFEDLQAWDQVRWVMLEARWPLPEVARLLWALAQKRQTISQYFAARQEGVNPLQSDSSRTAPGNLN